jgi:hypothetical protein
MTAEPDMAVAERLRRLEQEMGKLIEDVGGLKRRLTSIEALFGALNRDFFDRSKSLEDIEASLERIERCLEVRPFLASLTERTHVSTVPTPALSPNQHEQKGG